MGIDRSNIYKGPGTIQIGAAGPVLYDNGEGIDVSWDIVRGAVNTSMHGKVDSFLDDRIVKITLTPVGQITAAIVAALYPYQNPVIGSSIFGAADTPTIVHGRDGKKLTILNTAVTGMPDLVLSPGKTAFGQLELTGVVGNTLDPADDLSYYTEATEAFSDTSLDTSQILRLVYAGVWTGKLTSIKTEAGWMLSFDVGVQPQPCDDYGSVDLNLESVGAMAKTKPLDVLYSDLMSNARIQGAARGTTLREGADLVITGAGSALVATLKDSGLVEVPGRWHSTDLRDGEIAFDALRDESAGTFGSLFSIALA